MAEKVLVEVCVDSLHGALEAQSGGAGRLELCANLEVGGVTPSYGLMKLVKERICIPVHVLVRPRAGDFVYSALELEVMVADIEAVGTLGLAGMAIGALTKFQEIDMKAMRVLLDECHRFHLSVTFHRAFDCVHVPLQALKLIQNLGNVARILTSGQEAKAVEGVPLLRALTAESGKGVVILPGSGITENNAGYIATEVGATELHGSMRKELRVCSSENLLPGDKNRIIWTVDAEKLRTLRTRFRHALQVERPCTFPKDHPT